MDFLNDVHIARFEALAKLSGRTADRERLPLFYILAAFSDTFETAALFYAFEQNCIRPEAFRHVRLDYDSHAELVRLGFNLFNSSNKVNICDTLAACDTDGRKVAIEAIKIRFGL